MNVLLKNYISLVFLDLIKFIFDNILNIVCQNYKY